MSPLDKFAKFFVEWGWNRPLREFELMLEGKLLSGNASNIHRDLAKLSPESQEIVRKAVREIVDSTLYSLLRGLQEAYDRKEGVDVVVDGKNIGELSEMLNSEILGEDSWIDKYSEYKKPH